MSLTLSDILSALNAGACPSTIDGLIAKVGCDVSDLSQEHLEWSEEHLPDLAARGSRFASRWGRVPLWALASSGYGYGYGGGSGSGYGYGYGYGSGDGSGYGSGSGYGYGYGYVYGYVYGDGSGSGDCFGYGSGCDSGYGYGYGDDRPALRAKILSEPESPRAGGR